VNVRRYSQLAETGMAMVIGTGEVFVDDELIYTVKDAKVGVFAGIRYSAYPHAARNSTGGIIRKEAQV
jgi:3-hydroxyacyl-[acyl-carrier protein] dehydratase/trans-2-decenoyl-[acyl-carrier protein] isomerase